MNSRRREAENSNNSDIPAKKAAISHNDIPPDFDRPWNNSDVILQFSGLVLHAHKSILAIFSEYFRALFFGPVAKKNCEYVKMESEYEATKEVLRNIYQVNCSYKRNGQTQYDASMLRPLYKMGDYYGMDNIKKLCLDQMTDRPCSRMACLAASLDLPDTLMEILTHLPYEEVCDFLTTSTANFLFTKREFMRIFEAITGKPLPKSNETSSTEPLNLEDITVDIQNPQLDLTEPGDWADIMIETKNSEGRRLYSVQKMLNIVSKKFKNLPQTLVSLEQEVEKTMVSVTVDAEYTTMKEILSIIHHCDINYEGPERVLHPVLLHSMHEVAVALDIPMIEKQCHAKLLNPTSVDKLDVLLKIKGLDYRMEMHSLTFLQWRDWIYREKGHLSYRNGDEDVPVSSSQDHRQLNYATVSGLIGMFTVVEEIAEQR